MKVVLLNEEWEEKYTFFLLQQTETLVYVGNKYRKLLKKFLKEQDYYFMAVEKDDILGVFPSFLKNNSHLGNILNSLPFYGSNGGIIEYKGNCNVRKILLEAFYSLAREKNCISSTIITSPFEKDVNFYEKETKFTYKDERIGQITQLPDNNGDVSEKILRMIDEVRRRNIRKAVKNGIVVKENFSEEIWGD